jgi:CHASE2 domain-containing sensor protein
MKSLKFLNLGTATTGSMKNIWAQSAIITVFVFGMMWVVSKLTDFKLFTAFDVVGQALTDFELTDYAFSNLRPDPLVDQRIIIVNIGNLSRREVADQIRIINQYKPKVIGIDSYFNCEGGLRDTVNCPQLLDVMGNLLLGDAIQEAGNVVLVSKLLQTDSLSDSNSIDGYDSMEYSDDIFNKHARTGFANLVTNAVFQEDVKLCRRFIPQWNVRGKEEYAFAVKMCMMYDSAKTMKFLSRNKEEELINYRGNVEIQDIKLKNLRGKATTTTRFNGMYYAVDVDQLQRGEILGEVFKDNIVIMGFLGDRFGDITWSDKYFTPLNSKVAGRANPDMFGVVVHANIVAMILNQDYVNEMPSWLQYVTAFVICLFSVALLIVIDHHLPSWFDALSFVVQILLILIISLFVIEAFAIKSLMLDLSLTLAASALVGPCYDIFKSIQNEVIKRFTKFKPEVLKE